MYRTVDTGSLRGGSSGADWLCRKRRADRTGLGGHEGVDKQREEMSQQGSAGLRQLLLDQASTVDAVVDGHRDTPF